MYIEKIHLHKTGCIKSCQFKGKFRLSYDFAELGLKKSQLSAGINESQI